MSIISGNSTGVMKNQINMPDAGLSDTFRSHVKNGMQVLLNNQVAMGLSEALPIETKWFEFTGATPTFQFDQVVTAIYGSLFFDTGVLVDSTDPSGTPISLAIGDPDTTTIEAADAVGDTAVIFYK